MKKICFLLFFSILAFGLDREIIDTKIDYLTEIRKGIDEILIFSVNDPFVSSINGKGIATNNSKQNKNIKNKNLGFNIQAIVGNKVKINNTWKTIGDLYGKYKIVSIEGNTVYLKNGNYNYKAAIKDSVYVKIEN